MIRRLHFTKRLVSALVSATLIAGLFPVLGMPAASAAPAGTIHAAAYMGAHTSAGTTLPASVEIGGQSTAVNWLIADDTFNVPYDTVAVRGTAGDIQVAANVEVVPPASSPLVYYVDSGTGADWANPPAGNDKKAIINSLAYHAVSQLKDMKLVNTVSDQIYNMTGKSNTWGAVAGARTSAPTRTDPLQSPDNLPAGDSGDKSYTGLRTGNTSIAYRLTLNPGTFTLSSGFYDWYGTTSRQVQPTLDYTDLGGKVQRLLLDAYNTKDTKFISSEFTLPQDMNTSVPVTLSYTKVSGDAPILSWFAVAEGGIKQLIDEAKQAAASVVRVTLDGNDIQADNVNGLTFKGFGVLSANSTSALLMDYKAEHPEAYAEMLQILFGGEHPIMTQVKIEMGNDRNNSTGPDPATMRTEDEAANVARHPGFQLAADAKAVNPGLKVSILRWNAPAWADKDNDKIYTWYKKTILAAYRQYGFMADYVNPYINEHAADLAWTKQYADRVKNDTADFESLEEQKLYNSMRSVISDEVGIGSFGASMVNDASLREAVQVAGYHYNTDDDSAGNFKKLAEQFDMEVWNSEAQSTFSNSSFRPNNNMKDPAAAGTGIGGVGGPLEMSNTIVKGFANSRRTHFIYQPAIGSFYEGGQYSFKELLSMRDPWSGWIHYDAGLVILQHYSRFANVGWENEHNSAGIWRAVPQASYSGASGTNPVSGRNGSPSYITLAAPDKKDFSTIIVNDSEYAKTYKLEAVNMAYTGNPSLEVWETRAADAGEAFNSNYMQYLGDAAADGRGVYTVKVKPYSTVTVSTLKNKDKAEYNTPLPVEGERTVLDTDAAGEGHNTGDNMLYADDFDYNGRTVVKIGADGQVNGTESYIESRGGSQSAIPRYTHDRNGAFEAYLPEGSDNYVLRQQLDRGLMGLGGTWNGGDPVTAIGDNRWMNYRAAVDVSFENNNTQGGANYAAIGARYQGGGSSHSITGTPYVLKFWFDGGWQLLVNNSTVASGNVVDGSGGVKIDGFNNAFDAWHNIAVQVAGDKVTAYLDHVKLASYTDPNPKLSGRVDLASGYYHVRYDNLKVEKVDGFAPYYSELLDNLEMFDLAAVPVPKLKYNGEWSHANGAGMYIYQRSLSTSQAAGAELEYTFEGSGLDILGPNDGSTKLEVTVDGKTAALSAGTIAAKEFYQTYALRGLKYGQHQVKIKVVSGTLVVDAVAVISGEVTGTADTAALQAAVTAAKEVTRQDTDSDKAWNLFTDALNAAREALDQPALYRLDQEGAAQLEARLISAQDQLIAGDLRELAAPQDMATYVGQLPKLPAALEATREDGSKVEVAVKWNLAAVSFNIPYERVAVTGSYGSLKTIAYVEVVPAGLVYFLDPGVSADGDTPPYTTIKSFVGESLLNPKADQPSTGNEVWGHTNAAANYSFKGLDNTVVTTDKARTGVYGSNTKNTPLVYTLPLKAGKYTITSYHLDWWNNANRTMDIKLSYPGTEGAEVSEVIKTGLIAGPNGVTVNYDFTLPADGTVKYTVDNTYSNNQAAVLSYLAVARDQATVANEQAVREAKGIIEGAAYSVKKKTANSEEAVLTWVKQTIGELPGFSATGVITGDIILSSFQEATDDKAGSFTFQVTLSKGEAQADISVNGTITLPVPDTVQPVITLNGDATVNLPVGSEYADAGATAIDDQDGDITDRIITTVSSEVYGLTELDTAKEDIYTFHYNVKDTAGNKAVEVTRTVVVSLDPDVTKPVITLLGEASVQLENGTSYTDAGATAADDRDGDITARIITTLTKDGEAVQALDTAAAGTYLYHYNVTDSAGNAAVQVTRTVTIGEAVKPPAVTPTPSPVATPAPTDAPAVTTMPTPSVTPTPAPTPQTQKVLGANDFAAPAQGIITVQLADATESVLLPAGVTGITGENTLRLAWNTVAVDLTPEVLKSIQKKVAGGQAEGAQIKLSAVKTAKAAVEQLTNNPAVNGPVKLTAASDVMSFRLEVVAGDGTSVPVTTFDKPLRLTFTVDPVADHNLLGIYYIAANGSLEYIGGTLADGKLSAGIHHFSRYAVLEYDRAFSDVSSNSWASSVIKSMAAKHIIEGVSGTEFNPQGEVTRAQFAAMITRALCLKAGSPSAFTDLDSNAWYAEAVAAVSEVGIVRGRSKAAFAPNASITREEMAVMIVRAYEYLQGSRISEAAAGTFSDYARIQSWAKQAASIAGQAGLIKGRGNQQFAPQATMTRAESAQVISNLLGQL